MSLRIHLRNIASPYTEEDNDFTMVEWGDELPFILVPLLVSEDSILEYLPEYEERMESFGLYFSAQRGISFLKKVYEAIDKNPDLIEPENLQEYYASRDKVLRYLDQLPHLYFHLDLHEVYDINDETDYEQATEYLQSLLKQQEAFRKFISSNDPALLDSIFSPDLYSTPLGYPSFKEYLNDDIIEFGWAAFFISAEPEREVSDCQIFKKDDLQGLKDQSGNILIPPTYDEIYAFNETNLAVVEKDDKFGYINKQGRVIVPLIWDDALDMEHGIGLVCQENLWGMIDTNGNLIVGPRYDEIALIKVQVYSITLNGKFGLANHLGNILIETRYDHPARFYEDLYTFKINGTKKVETFNDTFQHIGIYDPDQFTVFEKKYIMINSIKEPKNGLLIDFKGNEVLKEVQMIDYPIHGYSNGLLFKQQGNYGIFGIHQGHWLLDPIYSKIKKGTDFPFPDSLFFIQHEDQTGIFDAQAFQTSWPLALASYEKITLLKSPELFSTRQDKKNKLFSIREGDLSDYEFDFIGLAGRNEENIHAYKGEDLFIIEGKTIRPITAEEVQDQQDHYYSLIGTTQQRFAKFYRTFKIKHQQDHPEFLSNEDLYETGAACLENKEYAQALKYYEISANRGYRDSMTDLGYLHSLEESGFLNYGKAFYWYTKAVKAGSPAAMNNLAIAYQYGYGCEVNIDQAVIYFELAAKHYNPMGFSNLGRLYYYGEHMEHNFPKALEYFKKAERHGYEIPDLIADCYYLTGDYKKALPYLKKDYQEGNEVSSYIYGMLYKDGLEVKQSTAKAIRYLEEALEKGHVQAHLPLAEIYKDNEQFKNEISYKYHLEKARLAGL